MHTQNTSPSWRRNILGRWKTLANSADKTEAHVGKALLDSYRHVRRADEQHDQDERPPARWPLALADLADQEPRTWSGTSTFKTGHERAHRSNSGTCLSVDLDKGWWYCSSCHQGGTAIKWLMVHENLTYSAAFARLMLRYG